MGMSDEPVAQQGEEGVITCRVTRWYYRRMGLMTAMFIGMGLYFFYDGMWGYGKKNEVAEKKEWFEQEVVGTPEKEGTFEAAKAEGEEAAKAWVLSAREKGWIISKNLQEPRWDDYAAPHGWESNPKKYSQDEIDQQFWWGGAVFIAGLFTGFLLLFNRNKIFVGHADHMIMPNGSTVKFSNVFKIDKRKWDNKGLAYAYHRESEDGQVQKAVIDDLKFGGADKVLTRLLNNFEGELIEKVPDEDEDEQAEKKADTLAAPDEVEKG